MAGPTSAQRASGKARLTRESISTATSSSPTATAAPKISLRVLGEAMGVDPTAIYRHFRDKAELLTAVTDRLLAGVVDSFEPTGDWREDLRTLALRTRACTCPTPSSPACSPSRPRRIRAMHA